MNASSTDIATTLLRWYDAHARALPWRSLPDSPLPDPYRIWLSEVMLQQTTVAAVIPYFEKFTSRWSTVEALAAAEDGEVMAAWAGLGYYARARNLLACARAVAAIGGRFPDTEAGLRALPGLGDYTAAAVAAIAFGQRAVVVDANVERVVARLFAIAEPLPAARKATRAAAEAVTPQERAGDFAQAMMDLGAQVCTSRTPRCLLCPLSETCRARKSGEPERYPAKPAKKAKPLRKGRAFWIEREGHVWLVRRAGKGMLGGMRALPDDGWSARVDGSGEAPLPGEWQSHGAVQHAFTHFALELRVLVWRGAECFDLPDGAGEWWPLDRIEAAGLPTLFGKAARLVTELGE
ncbi:MAG: A/G-specific adenine glycosylase [Alphaproteobacteria bacterium]|nr:A/G-specific adenine glycosylase [Alphaproteobacteria bacterium]